MGPLWSLWFLSLGKYPGTRGFPCQSLSPEKVTIHHTKKREPCPHQAVMVVEAARSPVAREEEWFVLEFTERTYNKQ